jgi:hypothetical protein
VAGAVIKAREAMAHTQTGHKGMLGRLRRPPAATIRSDQHGQRQRALWAHAERFTIVPMAGWVTCRVRWTLYVGGGLLAAGLTTTWSEVGRLLAASGRPRPVNSTRQSGPNRPANKGGTSVAIAGIVGRAITASLKTYYRGTGTSGDLIPLSYRSVVTPAEAQQHLLNLLAFLLRRQ